ncbi:MAG: hypothetical protein K6F69_04115 [Treponema sp.]|nr:hypothetical protein [Treponema sp.]
MRNKSNLFFIALVLFINISAFGNTFFSLGPILNISLDENSAPNPISYSLGVGKIFDINETFSIQPRITLFTQYYLWSGEKALPAEIENRTAFTSCSIIDIPINITLLENNTKTKSFEAGIGPSFFLRYAFLANGVKSSDSGVSGTAASDIKKINSYFYNNLNYLYTELYFSLNYKTKKKITIGLESKYYLAIQSLINKNFFNQNMFTVSIRFLF